MGACRLASSRSEWSPVAGPHGHCSRRIGSVSLNRREIISCSESVIPYAVVSNNNNKIMFTPVLFTRPVCVLLVFNYCCRDTAVLASVLCAQFLLKRTFLTFTIFLVCHFSHKLHDPKILRVY